MQDENKLGIVIHSDKEGLARIGNDVITLEDECHRIFVTDELKSFINYLKNGIEEGFFILYNHEECRAQPDGYNRNTDDIAICSLTCHPALEMLLGKVDRSMDLKTFEDLLRYMRAYSDSAAFDLMSWVKDFNVSKVTSIQRKKEPNGNYNFVVSRESSDREKYTPPEQITFTLPIFEHIETKISFTFDFIFDFTNSDDVVLTSFKIINPTFREDLKTAQKAILSTELNTLKNEKYWGSTKIEKHDNSWMYRENSLK